MRCAMLLALSATAGISAAADGGASSSSSPPEMVEDPWDGLSAPLGWRMVDRFDGFRFELWGAVQGVGLRAAVQAVADELACFGWVQHSPRGSLVGEARCAKTRGPPFRAWLEHAATGGGGAGADGDASGGISARPPPAARVDRAEFAIYADTKIKLHFSHFKVRRRQHITFRRVVSSSSRPPRSARSVCRGCTSRFAVVVVVVIVRRRPSS